MQPMPDIFRYRLLCFSVCWPMI